MEEKEKVVLSKQLMQLREIFDLLDEEVYDLFPDVRNEKWYEHFKMASKLIDTVITEINIEIIKEQKRVYDYY